MLSIRFGAKTVRAVSCCGSGSTSDAIRCVYGSGHATLQKYDFFAFRWGKVQTPPVLKYILLLGCPWTFPP
jgi:hypothetical protein